MKDRDILIYLHSLFLNDKYLDSILELENLEEVLTMTEEELRNIPNSKETSIEKILESRKKDYIKKLVENINKKADQVITIMDDDYPMDLNFIERPPRVLYVKGRELDLSNIRIAVVGARKATDYGKYVVEKFVRELSSLNVTIVSGMAQGIDATSHKVALDNGAYSIGVLGTGVDIKFPATNSRLYERMYKEGSIISEYPLGTQAQAFYFPERNRIISGLSQGVIVAEAKEKSGSLITARCGAEQGKEVFAVPGNINSIYSMGTNKLIRDGAIPLIEIEDITSVIPEFLDYEKKEEEIIFELNESERTVLDLIDRGLNHIDKIMEGTQMSIQEVSSTLTLLEMKDIIRQSGNSEFHRN